MMNFKELLIKAQKGSDEAKEELLKMYQPMLVKESIIDGVFDEDLYQELCYRFVCCVDKFDIEYISKQ